MGDPATEDDRLVDMTGRCAHMSRVDDIVGGWTSKHTKAALTAMLKTVNVPCAAVVTLPELLEDPHVRARGVLRTVTDDRGSFMTLGSPLFLSDSPMVEPARAGTLGEHTDDILSNVLRLSAAEIEKLRDAGVV